jgi:hypothetical protein
MTVPEHVPSEGAFASVHIDGAIYTFRLTDPP